MQELTICEEIGMTEEVQWSIQLLIKDRVVHIELHKPVTQTVSVYRYEVH